jgi:hypothetical protein
MKETTTTTEVTPVQVGESIFKIEVYEKTYYTLEVSASSIQAAKKLVRGISEGRASISDFQPNSNGGSIPSCFGNVVIQSIEKIS